MQDAGGASVDVIPQVQWITTTGSCHVPIWDFDRPDIQGENMVHEMHVCNNSHHHTIPL